MLTTPLSARIEEAFNDLATTELAIQDYRQTIDIETENTRVEHADDLAEGKNADARSTILAGLMAANEEYQQARALLRDAQNNKEIIGVEVSKLRLLAAIHHE